MRTSRGAWSFVARAVDPHAGAARSRGAVTAIRSRGRSGGRPVGGVLSTTGIGPTPWDRFAVMWMMAKRRRH